MLNSLIQAHLELEEELQNAISDDCATPVIELIDAKMADLDKTIRQTAPANHEEARAKLKFYLSRILIVGGGIVSKEDILTIEELFDHVLAGSASSIENSTKLASNIKP